MSWNKIKNDLKIKHIKNIISLTDYRLKELKMLLNNISENISENISDNSK